MTTRGFTIWFIVCAVLAVAVLAGAVTCVVIFAPHLLAMIDRIGH